MKSKYILIIGFFLSVSSTLLAQDKSFTINGKIPGKQAGYVYLRIMTEDPAIAIQDSALVINEVFKYQGKLSGVTPAIITAEKNAAGLKSMRILLSPGNLELSINEQNYASSTLSGTSVQEEMNVLNSTKSVLMGQLQNAAINYEKASSAYRKAVNERKDEVTLKVLKEASETAKNMIAPLSSQLNQKDREFMDKYPKSYVTASLLQTTVSRMPLEQSIKRYEDFPQEVKNSTLGRAVFKEIQKLRTGSPGSRAFDFSSTELRGEKISLINYRGKYVLVDFWASWCVPCRKGNPHLLDLYAKYKDKGFEIIGVSDDDTNPQAWRKAVEQDQIGVWKHVLRGLKTTPGGGFDRTNSIADKYAVNTLPTKILISPEGVIIGRYGNGGQDDQAMDKKLVEIFGI